MKYIRTKDGIFEVDGYDDRGVCVCGGKAFYRDEYIKQADTIEELCDGVIEKCLSGNRFCPIEIFNKQEAIKCINIDINKGYKEFYYGIFVEDNSKIDFISVAKMNENGDLVLI